MKPRPDPTPALDLPRKILLAALYGRIVLTPITPIVLLINPVDDGLTNMPTVLIGTAILVAASSVLAAAMLRPGGVTIFDRVPIMAADFAVTIVVNIVVSASFPTGTFWWPSRDPLLINAVLVAVTWAALRGWKAIVLSAGGVLALLMSMAFANGSPVFGSLDQRAILFARAIDACLGLSIGFVLVSLARTQATELEAQALASGRLAGQGETLRHLHDTSLATIETISHQAREVQRHEDDALAGQTVGRIRRIAVAEALRLRHLLDIGITDDGSSLRSDLEELVARNADLNCQLVLPPDLNPDLPEDCRLALLGAAAEALTNARRHAAGARIHISLDTVDADVILFVSDDGPGFDPTIERRDRHGIRGSIEDRLKAVGATCELQTSPGRGTRWTFRCPLAPVVVARPEGRQRLMAAGVGAVLVLGLSLGAVSELRAQSTPPEAGPVGRGAPDPTVFHRAWFTTDGTLGPAVGEVEVSTLGCSQNLRTARLLAFGCAGTARIVHGPWLALLDELGTEELGWPHNEMHGWAGAQVQDFAGGAMGPVIAIQNGDHVWPVFGAIRAWYVEVGGAEGLVGPPTGPATVNDDGTSSQSFAVATVTVSPSGEVTLVPHVNS